jgi:hypothetical protein
MLGLFRRKRHERAGFALYTAAVTAARDPWFYTALQVPDTLDGRFDLVGVHVFLIIDRVRNEAPPGPDVAQMPASRRRLPAMFGVAPIRRTALQNWRRMCDGSTKG